MAMTPQERVSIIEAQALARREGFFWLDVERNETNWHEFVQDQFGVRFHERHLTDSLNEKHPAFYDGTNDYDMLIVRAIDTTGAVENPDTLAVTFFILERCIVSVRPTGHPVFNHYREQLLAGTRKTPNSSAALLCSLINQTVDPFLVRREQITELIENWQSRLFDRNDAFDDWHQLVQLRRRLHRLQIQYEAEMDALSEWRSETLLVTGEALDVRFNDLAEHLRRVFQYAIATQSDIDSLVQIYFSATSQYTNRIIQFLAVVSAVFLPLNLIAGIFGMNFLHMPMLKPVWGAWLILGVMLMTGVGLLWWFRRQRWF